MAAGKMRKQWWNGIKRMLRGAVFGGVTVVGINLTVDLPVHEIQVEIDPVVNLNCMAPAALIGNGPARSKPGPRGHDHHGARPGRAIKIPG